MNGIEQTKREQQKSVWKHHFDEWEGSGLSQVDYRRKHGLSAGTWNKWRQLMGRGPAKQRTQRTLIPIHVSTPIAAPTERTPTLLQLRTRNGVEIDGYSDSVAKWVIDTCTQRE